MKASIVYIIFLSLIFAGQSHGEELKCRMDENGLYSALVLGEQDEGRIKDGLKYVRGQKEDDYYSQNSVAAVFGFFYIAENSLEAKYCTRLFNTNDKFKRIFDRDVGVPAKSLNNKELRVLDNSKIREVHFYDSLHSKTPRILKTKEDGQRPFDDLDEAHSDKYTRAIGRMYKNGLEKVRDLDEKFIEEGADWESILELNLKARSLWREIVERSRELNKEYPEEEARYNYFNENRFVKDKKEHKKLEVKIIEYKKEVLHFLDSSEMKVNYGLTKMSSFEPFFVQVILEFFAATNIYTLFDKSALRKHDYSAESLIIERNIFPDNIIKTDFYDENKVEELQRKFYYKSNLIPLLSMIYSMPGCSHLGLRPELSRTLIQGFNPILFKEFTKEQFFSMIANNARNCGSVEYMNSRSAHSFIYSNASKFLEDIVERFRDLSYL